MKVKENIFATVKNVCNLVDQITLKQLITANVTVNSL